jgi:hypothetical protein
MGSKLQKALTSIDSIDRGVSYRLVSNQVRTPATLNPLRRWLRSQTVVPLMQQCAQPKAAAEQQGSGRQADGGPANQRGTAVGFVHHVHKFAGI